MTEDDLHVGPIVNEIYLDGTIRFGATASWKDGPDSTTSVSVSGFATYEEACAAVRKEAQRLGWNPK